MVISSSDIQGAYEPTPDGCAESDAATIITVVNLAELDEADAIVIRH